MKENKNIQEKLLFYGISCLSAEIKSDFSFLKRNRNVLTPKTPETPKETPKGSLPYTGEDVKRMISVVGLALVAGVAGAMYLRHKKSKETEATQEDK